MGDNEDTKEQDSNSFSCPENTEMISVFSLLKFARRSVGLLEDWCKMAAVVITPLAFDSGRQTPILEAYTVVEVLDGEMKQLLFNVFYD